MSHSVKGCPGDLDATGKARWQLVKDDVGTRWRDVFAPILERYVRALGAQDAANDDLHTVYVTDDEDRRTGEKYRSSTPVLTTTGSQRQLVQHPSWKSWVEAGRVAADAAKVLGITPEVREAVEPAVAESKFGL